MNFCSNCGSKELHHTIPTGDNRLRYVCNDCGYIFYHNPKIVVGCLVLHKGKVLLCKRAIEPQLGYWNLPAGYMENGETLKEGAIREVWEEAKAKVEIIRLHCVFNVLHVHQVYFLFLAKLVGDNFGAGDETSDAKLFDFEEIPMDEIAFNSNIFAIEEYKKNPKNTTVHFGSYNHF